jgi:hypothetical protein
MIRRPTCIVIILLLCASLQLPAQKVELMFTTGMATYSMRDLKKMNDDLQAQIPFSTSVTDNFPMTFQFGGHFAVQLSNNYKIGILYAYNSTGSRLTSSDYSGSYYFDNIVTGHTIGMLNGFRVYSHEAFRIDFQANIGVVASILKMNEALNVADTSMSASSHFTATGIFLEPRFEGSYQWKHLKVGAYLGYLVNPMGKITDDDGQKSSATINWSGLRFGIEIGITSGTVKPRKTPDVKTSDSF